MDFELPKISKGWRKRKNNFKKAHTTEKVTESVKLFNKSFSHLRPQRNLILCYSLQNCFIFFIDRYQSRIKY